MGLFTLIINALMLTITAKLSNPLNLGLYINDFWSAVKGALVVSIVSILLAWLAGLKKIKNIQK